jgi:hypothetical protein
MLNLRRVRALVVLFMLTLSAGPVLAAEPFLGWQSAAVTANSGRFAVLDEGEILEVGWELRFAARRLRWLPHWVPDAIPVAGAMATSQGSLYGYAGLRWDIPVGDDWEVSPQFAAGLYYRDAGFELGGPVEFRSGIELTRRIGERHRVGLLLYHLSNAGIYRLNPGANSRVVTFNSRP